MIEAQWHGRFTVPKSNLFLFLIELGIKNRRNKNNKIRGKAGALNRRSNCSRMSCRYDFGALCRSRLRCILLLCVMNDACCRTTATAPPSVIFPMQMTFADWCEVDGRWIFIATPLRRRCLSNRSPWVRASRVRCLSRLIVIISWGWNQRVVLQFLVALAPAP